MGNGAGCEVHGSMYFTLAKFRALGETNEQLLLYRWIPASLRKKAWEATLTDEENAYIDECNRQLQFHQKQIGKTFVSRTTIQCPKYNHKSIVGLRVVIGNPLTSEADIDKVFWDQDAIVMSHVITKDVTSAPEAVILRDLNVPTPDPERVPEVCDEDGEAGKSYFDALWGAMSDQQRLVFNNDIETYFDAMITPDSPSVQRLNYPESEARKTSPWLQNGYE